MFSKGIVAALHPGLLLFIVLVVSLGRAPAQDVNNQLNIGLPANGVFSGSSFDNVQLNNGNLHIEIPLFSVPGRGLPVTFKYVYDNKGWYFFTHCNKFGFCTDTVRPAPGNNMNWKLATPLAHTLTFKDSTFQCAVGSGPYAVRTNYVLTEPDGTKHHFLPEQLTAPGFQNATCPVYGTTLYADDGSGWIMRTSTTGVPTEAVSPSGTVVSSSVRDSNGNQLINSTDTLGRALPALVFNSTTGKWELTYYDSSGTPQVIQITKTSVPVQTTLCVIPGSPGDACNDYSGSLGPVSEIRLPNGMSYTFTYAQNEFGEPTSVTLPTGGLISWTWGDPMDDGGRKVATRTVTADGQSYTWNYNTPGMIGVVDPLGNATRVTLAFLPCLGGLLQGTKTENFEGSAATGVLLKTVQTDYPSGGTCLPIRETTTWNQQNLVTKTETDWESFTVGNPPATVRRRNALQKREYAYGTGAPGSLVRKTSFNYLHLVNVTYKNLNIVDRPTSRITYDGVSVMKAQTQYTYDGTFPAATSGAPNHDYTGFGSSFLTRGNATQVKNWLTGGTFFITNNTYNDLGNLLTSTDPGGHLTTYSYTDDWANAACVPAGVNTQAYVTQAMNHLGQRSQTRFFPCTGLPERTRDENDILAGLWGRILTYDQMNRTLTAVQSDGGETDYTYDDVAPLSVTRSSRINGTQNLVSTTLLDGLGRASQSQLTSDPEGTVYVDTTYDALGRTATVSNPYRSGDTTYVTTSKYDALSRVIKVIPTDGTDASNNVSTVYAGNCTTVTDQAGKKRKSCSDALGRLIQVFEPDAAGSFLYETDYQYDTLDNLTRVDQKGNDANSANWRTRTFTYNSLSQLLTASNPESGTINYTYDSDGNLLTKVAPLPNQTGSSTVTITYGYDVLHRLTQKSYSDGTTATVKYGYDAVALTGCTTGPPGLTITNGIGRRTAMCDASGATAWSYDSEGRNLTERRTISGFTKSISYTYNLDGSLASMTYPSGRVVNYAYNAAARPLSAIDTANSINYATAATYAPQGSLAGVKYGVTGSFTGIVTSNTYNKRLQPILLSASAPSQTVLSFSYGFSLGTANNGNVLAIQNNRLLDRSQTFTYDQLNRVLTAVSTATSGTNCWGENFGYDIWGNLLTRAAGQSDPSCQYEGLSVVATTKNQISGFCYDAAGNLTRQAACGSSDYTYAAENRISTTAGVTYTYDGDGERVKKSTGTIYWGLASNEPLAEGDLSGNVNKEFIFFGGKRIARLDLSGGAVHYYFSDHLGSSNVVTNATGATIEEESDFYPFGGERVLTDLLPDQTYKFTGKERDAESGLDFFGARYYSSPLGRFITPDWAAAPTAVPYAEFGDPQSLNLYGYVRNNPLSHADPDGHEECFANGGCNALQNPASADHWVVNGLSNTLSDLLSLNDVAKGSTDMVNAETVGGKVGTGLGLALIVAINVIPGGGEGKAAEKGAEVGAEELAKTGGRLGSAETRALDKAVGQGLEKEGYTVTARCRETARIYTQPGGRSQGFGLP